MGANWSDNTFQSVWSKSRQNHIHDHQTDEAATNQKEESETESNSDPETAPPADNDPTQLVEEPEQKRLEFIATTEACDDETLEDVTKTKGDKPEEVSTDVSMTVDGRERVLWASLDLGARCHRVNQVGGGGIVKMTQSIL